MISEGRTVVYLQMLEFTLIAFGMVIQHIVPVIVCKIIVHNVVYVR